jgi:hypothetical protein
MTIEQPTRTIRIRYKLIERNIKILKEYYFLRDKEKFTHVSALALLSTYFELSTHHIGTILKKMRG